MANYSIKLDLKKMKEAGLVNIKGKDGRTRKCVVIPTDVNHEIYVGNKGIYLNLTAIETKEVSKFGDSHFIKGSIDKEAFESMSKEERDSQPILGNMRAIERKESKMQAAEISDANISVADGEEDLPF